MDLNADSSAFTNDMKAILGYEGLYSVTRDGRVWSHAKKAFKVLQKSHKGYLRVALYSGKGKCKVHSVHRLVYEAFISAIPDDLFINHADGNKENNALSNLEVVTRSQNELHAYRELKRPTPKGSKNGHAKLDEDKVKQIRQLLSNGTHQRDIAKLMGVTQPRISEVKNGRTWKHVA